MSKRILYRRDGKTDYHKRLGLLKSRMIRLVVRVTTSNVYAQLVRYEEDGDVILGSFSSPQLRKAGWKASGTNLPAAYLVGYGLGKKFASAAEEVILDSGQRGSVVGSRVYAVVKGVIAGGIAVRSDEAILPSDDRVNGKHIEAYAETLSKEDKDAYQKRFSLYIKNKIKPENISKHIEEIKATL